VTGDALTAVVLNWRTHEMTLRACRALLDDGVPAERLVVVDNGSGDGSPERLRAALPGSLVVPLDENVGFARANNRAALELPARHAYLLVNSDAFVHAAGSVARLLDELRDPSVGAAVPRLRNPDGSLQESVYPLSTPLPELVRAAGLSRIVPEPLAPRLAAHWDHGRTRDVPGAVGAVLLVRALAWDQLGGFDERRFMYAEDLDLFWRLHHLGWRTRFVADSEFVHLGGASSTQRWDDPGRARRVAAAEAEMLRAHLRPVRYGLTVGAMAAGVGARALLHAARGNREAAASQRAWLRGYLSGCSSSEA
jgi:GT2 family glycosyltransferase